LHHPQLSPLFSFAFLFKHCLAAASLIAFSCTFNKHCRPGNLHHLRAGAEQSEKGKCEKHFASLIASAGRVVTGNFVVT
jgi:hypothetical protein